MSLKFRTEIRDIPFLVYIRQEQAKRPKHHKLNVFQLMAIYNVCFGEGLDIKSDLVDGLVKEGILIKAKSGNLSMSKEYQSIFSEIHSIKNVDWVGALKSCAAKYKYEITRKTYMEYLPDWVSVDRVRYVLSKLEAKEILKRDGVGKGTKYTVIKIPDSFDL